MQVARTGNRLQTALKRHWMVYLMAVPVMAYYIVFCYLPMFGIVIAFQEMCIRDRFCAVAIGTDTSFSIVGCAAEHGIVGLKPACGALISAGIVPISRTLDSAGPMARDVASALAVYAACLLYTSRCV